MVTEALDTTGTKADLVSKMYKDIHSWAVWSIVLGVAYLVFFYLLEADPAWGIVLIITAVLSWKARIPHMFRFYAVLMACAALSNLLSGFATGDWSLSILGVIQVPWAVSLVRQSRKYRQLPLADLHQSGNWPEELPPPQDEGKILSRFSKASLLILLILFLLFMIACLGVVIYGYSLIAQGVEFTETDVNPIPETELTQPAAENQPDFFFSSLLSMVILAFALGTTALVPENPKRDLALVGVIINSSILLLFYALAVLGTLMPS